ncbi:MAG: hypothetical protein ACRD4O_10305 [Bryobacteraceae bacterium]
MKVAELELAGTVAVEGTDATPVLELYSETLAPPEGAGPERLTFPVTLLPPCTVAEESVRPFSDAEDEGDAVTVIDTERLSPFRVAVILTVVVVVGDDALIENEAEAAPAGTATVAGTDRTEGSSLDKVTAMPPLGAAALRVTVPTIVEPPVVVAADVLRPESTGAGAPPVPFTTRIGESAVSDLYVDESATGVVLAIEWIVTGTFAETAPAGMMTDDGALTAAESELAIDTVAPVEGAGAVRIA